jgi:hypothetical protein
MAYLLLIDLNRTPPYSEVSGLPDTKVFKRWGVSQGRVIWSRHDEPPAPQKYSLEKLEKLDANGNLKRKALFESQLAQDILLYAQSFVLPAVLKVSRGILEVLQTELNQPAAQGNDASSGSDNEVEFPFNEMLAEIFSNYLYTEKSKGYYGVLGYKGKAPKDEGEQVEVVLKSLGTSNFIPLHLNAHRTFVSHIIGQLRADTKGLKARANQLEQTISPNPKYAAENARDSRNAPRSTTKIGILANPDSKLMNATDPDTPHIRAVEKYKRPQQGHTFMANADKHKMPFIAGPSNSAAQLFQCAALMNLTQEELLCYGLACVAFLVGGGMHSFHEVMKSGKKAGIPYRSGNYSSALPEGFKRSIHYRWLAAEFYEFVTL